MSNYPYNPYGYQPQQYQEEYRRMQQNANEKREFRHRSILVGCSIIIFELLTFTVSMGLVFSGLREVYFGSTLFSYSVEMIFSIVSMLGAYFIAKAMIDKKHVGFIPLAKPENKKHALLLIPFGVAACFAGSYATGILNTVLEEIFNVTFEQPEIADPKTPLEAFVFILSASVVPAIVEEIALRAGVLQAMRKYGDWFAIFTSAFIFAVLHGNMIQTPFAFIAGIGLGYVFCATGSIWPGIIIHFINNFTSCISTMGPVFGVSDEIMNSLYMAFFSLVLIAGVVCFVLYLIDKKRPVLNKDNSTLTLSQKIGGFLFNIPMIISLIYMGYNTAQYIK